MLDTTNDTVSQIEVWERVRAFLRVNLAKEVHDNWFASAQLDEINAGGDIAYVSVAHKFLAHQISQPDYFCVLEQAFRQELGREVRVRIRVRQRHVAYRQIRDPEATWKRPVRDTDAPKKEEAPAPLKVVEAPAIYAEPSPEEEGLSDLDRLVKRLYFEYGRLSIKMLIKMVSDLYNMPVERVTYGRNTKLECGPRHLAMYLAVQTTGNSTSTVGRCFGGRDHTTVVSATKKIKGRRESDPEFNDKIQSYIDAIERWKPSVAAGPDEE